MLLKTDLIKTNKNPMIPFSKQFKISLKGLMVKSFKNFHFPYKNALGRCILYY